MDYTYLSAQQQQPPYHQYAGMTASPYPPAAVDPDTIRSIVCVGVPSTCCGPVLEV